MNIIKLQVKTRKEKYPIIIGNNILYKLQKLLKENLINFNQCLIVVDKNVPKKLLNKVLNSFSEKKVFIYYFTANEKNKNQKSINKILSLLLSKNFNRTDCLISIGGGITGDVSGFAASIFKRGLKFVNIPTTLLSQVDSSIGGKTGVNSKFGKNLIGAFYQPSLVISDIDFLKSLPKRELVCGYGEILKHALIADKNFFSFLDKNGSQILKLKSPLIEQAIYQSCSIKKRLLRLMKKKWV
jgi:3-dehydroquinate synthase